MGMTIQDAWANANIGNDMTDAPERIWFDPNTVDKYVEGFAAHSSPAMREDGGGLFPEYIRADIKPKVKPLVWEKGEECQIRSRSIIGEIICTKFGGKWLHHGDCFGDDVEAAKAAAQADYERRILSALA